MEGRQSSNVLTPDAGNRSGTETPATRSDAAGSRADTRPTSNVSENPADQDQGELQRLNSNMSSNVLTPDAGNRSGTETPATRSNTARSQAESRPTSNVSETPADQDRGELRRSKTADSNTSAKQNLAAVAADSNLSAEQNSAAESARSSGQGSRASGLRSATSQSKTPDTGQQQKETSGVVRVSLADDTTGSATAATPPKKRVSSSRRRMERELERMREADENARLRKKDEREREVKKAITAMYDRKRKEGVTLTRGVEESRTAIRKVMVEEERMALEKKQKELRKETRDIQDAIDEKYGLKDKKKGHDLLALADDFYQDKVKDEDGLPELVRRELTNQELNDLKMVFDMFDLKGRGYITANDVRRAASMLGFKAKKQVFKEMIDEMTGERPGRVTFALFLQFVVRGQGDGNDPLEYIMQCFRLLDKGQKGYLTKDDLRQAADDQKLSLSNRAIREMIQEADVSGDARVTSDEFIHIMLQTSMFHSTR